MKNLTIADSKHRMQKALTAKPENSSPELETLIQEFLVLGLIKPGHQIALYCGNSPISNRLVGKWIDKNSTIHADIENCVYDFFKKQVIRLLRLYGNEDLFDIDNNYVGPNRISIISCYLLFLQIVSENVKFIMPDNCTMFSSCADFCDRSIIEQLLCDIVFEKIRKGTYVTGYVKNLKHIPPAMLNIFQKTKNGRYKICNSNINSYEFQIAFLSTFRFTSSQLQYIFELKLNQWVSRHLWI